MKAQEIFRVPVDTGEATTVYDITADSSSHAAEQALLLHKSLYPKTWRGAMVAHVLITTVSSRAASQISSAKLAALRSVSAAAAEASANNDNVIDFAARRRRRNAQN